MRQEKNAYDMTFDFGLEGRKKNSGKREQHEYVTWGKIIKLVKGMYLGWMQHIGERGKK